VEGLGCRSCAPSLTYCDGARRLRCNVEGSALEFVEECAQGLSCAPAGCRDLCREAESDRSYLGCDYWPVFTVNHMLDPLFTPAVTVGNGNLVAAHVVISKGDSTREVEVPSRSSATIELAFDPVLKDSPHSSLVRGGAYHLQASVPVTVHQFNPLYFQRAQMCLGQAESRTCSSHTNDASLLLPTSALRPDPAVDPMVSYMVAARGSFVVGTGSGFDSSPGMVAIVAMGEAPIEVSVTTSAHTRPSADPTQPDAIGALAPGQTLARTLAPGDVLQLLSATPSVCPDPSVTGRDGELCDAGPDFDLTGTVVRASGPVQVIGGSDCTFVPFDRPACDHLEESLPPLRTWGTTAVVTRPLVPDRSGSLLRVLSSADANQITFDPPVHEPVLLSRGQFVELEVTQPLLVRGSAPLLVAQYLVGQGVIGNVGGDPSLSLSVPVDQYRRSYDFTSPPTYSFNYVDIIAALDDVVWLDGKVVKGFAPIGQSGFATATVELLKSGAHEAHGERASGIGLVLYGIARYTSYMLPGGLDLRPIAEQGF